MRAVKIACKLPKLTGHRSPENPSIGSLCFIVWTRGFGVNHSIFATKYLGVSGTNFSARGVQRVCISINGGITYYSVLMVAIMAFY